MHRQPGVGHHQIGPFHGFVGIPFNGHGHAFGSRQPNKFRFGIKAFRPGKSQVEPELPGGDNVIRLLPPLNLTEDEIARAVDMLDQAATAVEAAQ